MLVFARLAAVFALEGCACFLSKLASDGVFIGACFGVGAGVGVAFGVCD